MIRRHAFDCAYARAVYTAVCNLTSVLLSSMYMEACKDRLYCSQPDDPGRRACQTVLAEVRTQHFHGAFVIAFRVHSLRHLPVASR